MPVRSLNSSVLIWPKREQVVTALEACAKKTKTVNPALCLVGYFGSVARGDWGLGSDLDDVILVEESELPFERWVFCLISATCRWRWMCWSTRQRNWNG